MRSRTASLLAVAALLTGLAGCAGSDDNRPLPQQDGFSGRIDGSVVGDAYVWPDFGGGLQPDGRIFSDTGSIPQQDSASPPSGDGGPIFVANCGGTSTIRLQEIAVGGTDYIALKNTGGAPQDLVGHKLVMYGISPTAPDIHVFAAQGLAAGQIVHVFEYSYGQAGDINTGDNIPFYNGPDKAAKPNAAALFDASGNLLDYVSIRIATDQDVGLPTGASSTPVLWPPTFDSSVSSFHRVAQQGACPSFLATDWSTAPLSRP